jgi:hypothetical protein
VSAAGASRGDASNPFSPVMALGLAIVGVFAFAALIVLSSFAPELSSGNDGGEHALSRSGLGFAGIVELLNLSGDTAIISRGRLTRGKGDGLLVLTPGVDSDPAELKDFNFSPSLVVLPKWQASPDAKTPSWVVRGPVYPPGVIAGQWLTPFGKNGAVRQATGSGRPVLSGVDGGVFQGRTLRPGPIDRLQTVSGPGWDPVITDAAGNGVLLWNQQYDTFLLSDPDLLNTHGLKDADTAREAVELLTALRAGSAPILFDVTLHGYKRERSLMRLILAPPYLGMTLVLVFAVFLMALHGLARFGPTRKAGRAFAFGKQALADNTAGLVRMAGREPRMAAPYASLTRTAVARALSAPRDMNEAQLDAFLDRLGQSGGATHRWSDLIARAGQARTVSDLMAVAQDLYRFKREISREP